MYVLFNPSFKSIMYDCFLDMRNSISFRDIIYINIFQGHLLGVVHLMDGTKTKKMDEIYSSCSLSALNVSKSVELCLQADMHCFEERE